MSFADKVEVEVKAGKGGDGKLSFLHEKFRAMGGPDGGDGGRGGSVIFEANHNTDTLSRFKTTHKIEAEDGQGGGTNRKRGRSGQDVIVPVPPGTIVLEGDKVLADLTTSGQQQVIARGGRGGFGNAHFKASARQAPRVAELGEQGERLSLTLELKLVADVGLVGLPNAGKSTLLSVISNAKPEIGDYPFTTLVPNLGIVDFEDSTFMVADIPGLIEGASEGKGLGDEFLRHIERTAVVIHLIDANGADIVADYQTIENELKEYQVDLTGKPQIIALTKTDGMPEKDVKSKVVSLKKASKRPIYAISSVAHQGLDLMLREVVTLVKQTRNERQAAEAEVLPVIDITTLRDGWTVEKTEDGFVVTGSRIESFGHRTNWDNPDAVERLRDIMRKQGIAKELEKQGIEFGDIIKLGTNELEWL